MTWIFWAILVFVVVWIVATYNGFIRHKNRATEAASDIEVQLKRRFDLIPNLVNTVKGYATHESEAFEKVTKARAEALSAQGTPQSGATENILQGALKSLFAVAEAYPDLKANTNFLELQRELSDTENKIQSARRFYNANVRDFNTALQMFPGNIIGAIFHFSEMQLFDLPDDHDAHNPVDVSFT